MRLIELVSHEHGIDLEKITREFDPRWAIEREQAAGVMFGPYHRAWLFDRAPEQVKKILARMQEERFSEALCSKQGFTSSDYTEFPSASLRAAINTTVTETNLWDPGVLAPLPVGEIRSGRAWQLDFGGVHGTTGTPAISFRARCGTNNAAPPTGVDLGVGPTMTLGTFTAQPFHGSGIFGCRSIGVAASTATITGSGFVICAGAAAATTVATCVFGGLIPTTIDQTVAQGLSVSVIWGTSSASNTLTPQWMMYASRN
ncbi:MAG TPA: hypothetical protein VE967_19685 [Gemmatimonadaceae bacterium]|nr:hypothetical protein [Gemmatimonadaceae bacterium]